MATYTMQELELETAELLPARETLNCYRAHGSSCSTSRAGTCRTTVTATATTAFSAAGSPAT